jgi:tetratricopeptide (TPR) repeat protein
MTPRIALLVLALCAAARAEDGPIPITCKAPAVALVQQAQVALDNIHIAQGTALLERAVTADPGCATAHAFLVNVLPATKSGPHMKAALQRAGLPLAERTRIEFIAAGFAGENAKARTLAARLVEEAPGDFRARNQLGGFALADQDYPKAIKEFSKAIEINPKGTAAINNLGYAYIGEEDYPQAVAAFRKYAEVAPEEPNAHDSLAESLLNVGQLAESEAEFQKALALDAKFAGAWTGIAQVRLMQGNEHGADEALANELQVDARPQVALGVEVSRAYALVAEGRAAQGYQLLDEVQARAAGLGLPMMYFADAIQARLQMREGNLEKALALANRSLQLTTQARKLPGGLRRGLMQGVLIEVVRANALLKKKAATDKALAAMEEAVRPAAQVAFNASQLQNSRGMAALAAGDAAGAVRELQKCQRNDFQCRYELWRVQEEAGDAAGAAATRDAFLKTPRRGIEYVVLWKKMGGAARNGG